MKNYYVYAIKSLSSRYIYIGLTTDVDRRVKEHNLGWEKTTKPYRPFKLLFLTWAGNKRTSARLLEKYFKTGFGREFIKNLKHCQQLYVYYQ